MRVTLVALCSLSAFTLGEWSQMATAEPDPDADSQTATEPNPTDRMAVTVRNHPIGVAPESSPQVMFSEIFSEDSEGGVASRVSILSQNRSSELQSLEIQSLGNRDGVDTDCETPRRDRPSSATSTPQIQIRVGPEAGAEDCEGDTAGSAPSVQIRPDAEADRGTLIIRTGDDRATPPASQPETVQTIDLIEVEAEVEAGDIETQTVDAVPTNPVLEVEAVEIIETVEAGSELDYEPTTTVEVELPENPGASVDLEIEMESEIAPLHSTEPRIRVEITDDDAPVNLTGDRPNVLSPLLQPQTRLLNLETANFLDEGALQLRVGAHQSLANDRPNAGTGTEVYDGSIDYGITDDWQVGITANYFDDPPVQAIDGEFPNLRLLSLAPHVKYRLMQDDEWAIALQGAVELLQIETEPGLFNDTSDDEFSSVVVGTLQAPVTFNAAPDLQLHLTPSLAVTPTEVNDGDFYGTFFNLGAGVNWQATEQLGLYGTLNAPLGPGGNTVESDEGDIVQRLVWAVGARYAVTPRVGVDLYGTNAFGTTPTTGLLSFLPDGDSATVGVALTYTPDIGLGYRSSFRDEEGELLSQRDTQLLMDGLTLTTANTLQPGMVSLGAGVGFGDRFNAEVAYSPDEDFQIEATFDEFGAEDTVSSDDSGGTDLKYLLGARVRLLDQRRGDPVTLGARLMGGRDTGDRQQVGILFTELPLLYQANDQLALLATPKAAFFSDQSRIGLGLGVNYALPLGFQVIGEVTPVLNGERPVWSAGARYQQPDTNLGIDVYVTNAIGRNGLGSLVGESSASVGVNLNWLIGQ